MANTANIQILRSYSNTTPTSLLDGQLAYSFKSNTLYIGSNTGIISISDPLTRVIAQSAYNQANTATVLAQAAFNQANTSNVLAQAAFDNSNTKFSSSGGTISGSVAIANNLTISGNLTVLGNTTTISTNQLDISDSLIYLANNNLTSDIVDIGIIGHYANATSGNSHTGIFRDPSRKEWIFFEGYTPEVQANNLINIAHPSFAYANLWANTFKGNIIGQSATISGFNVVNYMTSAYAQANVTIGVSTSQNARMTIIEGVDTGQNAAIVLIQGTDFTQNAQILVIQGVDNTQNTSMAATDGKMNSGYTVANNATSNTIIIQGVDVGQNSRMTIIEGVDTSQNARMTIIEATDVSQNTSMAATDGKMNSGYAVANSASSNTIIIQGVDTSQNARMLVIEGTDTSQNARMVIIEGVNASQNVRLDYSNTAITIIQGVDTSQNARMLVIEGTNTSQNARMTIIEGTDVSQNARMLVIEGTDVSQNARMTINEGVDASQNVRLDYSNTAITIIQGTDTSQNARMTIIEGTDVSQNARMTIIEGTDVSQNTSMAATDGKMNSAFTKANNALANTTGTFAGTLTVTGNVIANSFQTSGSSGNISGANFVYANTFVASNAYIFPDGSIQTTAASASLASGAYNQANTATVLAQAAYNQANVTIGIDTSQNARMVIIEATDVSQNARMLVIEGTDTSQNARMTIIEGTDVSQNARMTINEGVDVSQNVRLDYSNTAITIIQGTDTSQNARMTIIEGTDSSQNVRLDYSNTAITIIQGTDVSQNARMTIIEGVDVTQNTNISNKLSLTGALSQTVSGNVTISQDLIVSGNLIITGNINSQNVQQFSVADPLILLGVGNYFSDTKDIGFVSHYNDGSNAHTGLIRDSGTKEYYLFKGYTPEVDATNNVDITDATFTKANLNASYVKGNLIATTAVVGGLDVNTRLDYSNTAITIIQGVDIGQNSRMTIIEGVDVTQNTNITAVNTKMASAYDQANTGTVLAQASFNLANTRASLSGYVANTIIVANQAGYLTNSNSFYTSSNNTLITTGNLKVLGSVTANNYIGTGSGVATVNSASNLDLSSPVSVRIVGGGTFRLPSLSSSQINSLIASNGDVVYNTDINKIQTYENGIWRNSDQATSLSNVFSANSIIFANSTGYLSNSTNFQYLSSNNTLITGNIITTGTGGTISNANVISANTFVANGVDLLIYTQAAFASANVQSGINLTQNTNITIIQGVDIGQNSRMTIIEGVDVSQNARMTIADGVDASQNVRLDFSNTAITIIQGVDVGQNTRLTVIEGTDISQNVRLDFSNTRMTIIEGTDVSQNVRLDYSNTAITIIQGVDTTQNTRLTVIEGTDVSQNVRLDYSNTAITIIQGTDVSQNIRLDYSNTAITIIQGVDVGQNARMVIIEGTNASQNVRLDYSNTAITQVDNKAQAAFDKANTGGGGGGTGTGNANTFGWLANTVIVANSTGYLSNSNLFFTSGNNALITTGAVIAGGEISVATGQFVSFGGPGSGTRIRRDAGLNGLDLQTNSLSRVFIADSDGSVNVRSTASSTSNTTGALVVSGGLGVSGNVYVANAFNSFGNVNFNLISTSAPNFNRLTLSPNNYLSTDGSGIVFGGTGYVYFALTGNYIYNQNPFVQRAPISNDNGNNTVLFAGSSPVRLQNTAASISNTTGALIVDGGLGLSGNLSMNLASSGAQVNRLTLSPLSYLQAYSSAGSIEVGGSGYWYFSGNGGIVNQSYLVQRAPIYNDSGNNAVLFAGSSQVKIQNGTASTNTTTGALIVQGGVGIAGALNATTKSFNIPHPTKEDKNLRYGSLEGPEFGVYVRGTLKGSDTIELPDYWTKLVDANTITVSLTPIGKYQKLSVKEIKDNTIVINSDGWFRKEINCYYIVFGERADVDKLDVEA